jgi:glycosyltransferase involved in cell wall biosynthesis
LKYFEAALAGTVVVASPTYAFREAIQDGDTGFLAAAHRWDDKLAVACNLLDGDGAAYRRLVTAAHEQVTARYAPDRQAERIVQVLFGKDMASDG